MKKEHTDSVLRWLVGISLVLILSVLILSTATFIKLNNALKGDTAAAPTPSADDAAAPSAPIDTDKLIDDDAILGNKNAKVTIVEWSDYQCPFCVRFHSDAFQQIKTKYIDTGKVKFVYRDFPLSFHQFAQKAAEAAECAGEQGKYFDMHEKLFTSGVEGDVASFKQYAKDLGLDSTKFDTCLDSGAMAKEITKDMNDGAAVGVRGTPGFIVNGELVSGAQPFAVFEQAIEAALKQ